MLAEGRFHYLRAVGTMDPLTVGRLDRRDLVTYTATLARPAVSKQSGRRGGFLFGDEWGDGHPPNKTALFGG